jgi:peptide/nickel transport system permease protein
MRRRRRPNSMIRFLARRTIHGIVVMLIVTFTVFFVTRMIADPVRTMLPLHATEEQRDTLRDALGLSEPIWQQFVTFVGDLLTLDLGESLWQRAPALDLVLDRLPATFLLVATGTLLGLAVFIPLGVVAALRPGSWLDRSLVTVSLFGLSMPQFWLGAMLILIFSVKLGWFPTSGNLTVSSLVLPSLTLALTGGGRVAQIARSSMLDQLRQPYVTTARAKGFSSSYILWRHVLRNALVPILTIAAWEVARSIAGYAVVVETVFAWPGIGRLAIQAIQSDDIILLQAVVFVAAFLVVVINIVSDLLYTYIDPRIKLN